MPLIQIKVLRTVYMNANNLSEIMYAYNSN